MPPIREHQILYTFLGDEDDEGEHTEEDEDMPPLVDPPPATQESMMSSFDFGGVAFGAPAFAATLVSAPDDRDAAEHDADANTSSGRGRKSRAAQRAAPSYIPRPPNAFILFRSSFIRSQNVPGRVEGNHSTLSKIIGKYWHALPPEERARWEDKARAAQAEHRRRYPDWRFRPGNGKNAFASGSAKPKGRRKGRIKDGGGADDDPPENGKGKGRAVEQAPDEGDQDDPDPERGRDTVKGKGKATAKKGKGKGKGKERARDPDADAEQDVQQQWEEREKEKRELEEKERERQEADARCEKISDLLVEGKTGRALEAAVEEWEGRGRGRGRVRARSSVTGKRARERGRRASRTRDAVSSDEERERERGREAFAPPPESPFLSPNLPFAHSPPFAQPASPYAQHPPPSPYAPPSPFAQHQHAHPHPPPSPFLASPSASPVHTPTPGSSTAAALMLPPLTHMYKRSLSAPCGVRVSLPSPFVSPVLPSATAQPVYPPTPPYFTPLQEPQQYANPLPLAQGHGHGHTHVRRDTISLPVAPGAGLGAGVRLVGGYQHPSPPRRERGAYTYPPPYAHTPLPMPDVDDRAGPAARYGGESHARVWWERTRSGQTADSQVVGQEVTVDVADEGWADAGLRTFSNAYAPSQSPPLASPFLVHTKPAGSGAGAAGTGAGASPEVYASPPPLSPLSPSDDETGGSDARFRFPPTAPAITRFSTLSGWAGDLVVSPSMSVGTGTISFAQPQGQASGSGSGSGGHPASGGGSGSDGVSGTPPRTSGWYAPPGWENSVQGAVSGSGARRASAAQGWPARGDVEMYYDAEAWGPHR